MKAGFKEVTREGWEYELTVNLELELNHYASASKDRTGLFMGKPAFIPSEETGRLICNWCNEGLEPLSLEQRVGSCKSLPELLELFQSAEIGNDQTLNMFSKRRKELQETTINNQLNFNNNGTTSSATN